MTSQNKPQTTTRITVIDALRGFALLGVIVTHTLQHFSIYYPGQESGEALFPKIDSAIEWLLQNVIMGKFINIFAFLFGMSFFIQMDNAQKKGIGFRKRFSWRMAVLFLIGVIGNCFYSGDILSIYAIFGFFLLLLYPLKNNALLLIAFVLVLGLPRILSTGYKQVVKTEQSATTTPSPQPTAPEAPSFLNSATRNLTIGLEGKLNYQFGLFGRGYLTFALFILGLVVGRSRFFEEVHTEKRRNINLLALFAIAVVVINITLEYFMETPPAREILMRLNSGDTAPSLFVVLALKDMASVALSGVLAMGFIVLYQTRCVGKYLEVITPYGRMGLTNYETQGIVGCILFSAWGFGSTFGSWGTTALFVLGLILYVSQVVISRYWLNHFQYGPLEWLWRSATYFKLQPLRKRNTR